MQPPLDTQFFLSGPQGRTQGGLFSLDGVHPTTVASGVIADEVMRLMVRAGVSFPTPGVDFERVLQLDTLNSQPPTAIASTISLLGWLDEQLDWTRRMIGR
jgi:hypothetical protein